MEEKYLVILDVGFIPSPQCFWFCNISQVEKSNLKYNRLLFSDSQINLFDILNI
jgi:hypothetical protein